MARLYALFWRPKQMALTICGVWHPLPQSRRFVVSLRSHPSWAPLGKAIMLRQTLYLTLSPLTFTIAVCQVLLLLPLQLHEYTIYKSSSLPCAHMFSELSVSGYTMNCVERSGGSLQWGAWASVGMASQNADALAQIKRSGMGIIEPSQGLQALVLSMGSKPTLIVNPFRWSHLLRGVKAIPAIFSEQISQITTIPKVINFPNKNNIATSYNCATLVVKIYTCIIAI